MIREVQRGNQDGSILLMPGRKRPMLPPLEDTDMPGGETQDEASQQ
jgi:hypothetical protein